MNTTQKLLHTVLLGEGYVLTSSCIYCKKFRKLGQTLEIYIDFREKTKYPSIYAYKESKAFDGNLLNALRYNVRKTIDTLTKSQTNINGYF